MLQFEALLLLGLIVAGAQFRRWKVVEGLWIVFWAHMALGSVRHAPIFVAVTAPIIAVQLSDWWNHWTAHVKKSSLPGILNLMAADALKGFRRTSVWPAAAVVVLALMGAVTHPHQMAPGFSGLRVPREDGARSQRSDPANPAS